MTDGGKHWNVRGTIRKSTRLRQINAFAGGIVADAARLFVFCQQRRKHPARGNVISEFEPIADDFVDAKVKCNRPDGEIQCSSYQDIAIAQVSSCINKRLGLRKDR